MRLNTISQFFPDSQVSLVHQNGRLLTEPTKGVEIFLHTRENEKDPCCAELSGGDHYAEIGLWFEGNELTDYDGVFSLPREIAQMLTDAGYIVPHNFFDLTPEPPDASLKSEGD
jgi:hypothetical protein